MNNIKTESVIVSTEVAYDAFPRTSPVHRWTGSGTLCGDVLTTPVVFDAGTRPFDEIVCVRCQRAASA